MFGRGHIGGFDESEMVGKGGVYKEIAASRRTDEVNERAEYERLLWNRYGIYGVFMVFCMSCNVVCVT